jgi:putative Holliday junction resolvase
MEFVPPGTVIGIDFGTARIGVSASDDLRMFAHPVETIETARTDPLKRIADIVRERKAEVVVVGLPLRMDGSEGSAAERVQAFIGRLRPRLPDTEIVLVDERLTTKEAQEMLEAAGRKPTKTNRDNQEVIDQAAAVLILQDYLDHGRHD